MRNLFYIISFILVLGCSSDKIETVNITKGAVYEQSEMSALMLKMYAINSENKKLILKGKSPKEFPKEFLNIHTVKLTDSTDRNFAFKGYSDFYLKTFQQVYQVPKDSLKQQHNNTVNSCISCHKTTCIGPIPKIKKLLIP